MVCAADVCCHLSMPLLILVRVLLSPYMLLRWLPFFSCYFWSWWWCRCDGGDCGGASDKRNGLEAWRLLRREMEPKEKARALAMVRQLASWRFDEKTDLHSQLIRYEEALRTYAVSSGKEFPEELVLATVVTGLRGRSSQTSGNGS